MKVAIFSVPFGGGHDSVAQAIASYVSDLGRNGVLVTVLDAMSTVSRHIELSRLTAWLYFLLSRPRFRPIYRLLFNLIDRWPEHCGAIAYLIFGARAREWLSKARPDIVVSTYPLVTWVVGAAIRDLDVPTRLVCMVTDGGKVNRSWFHGRADLYIATHTEAVKRGRGVTSAPVQYAPLPLRPEFTSLPSQVEARRRLNIECDQVALVWGGGQGMASGTVALAHELQRQRSPVMPIFVTGSNRRLARRLRRSLPPRAGLIIERAEQPGLLLSAADIVVGKPGWISLAEAVAAGRHTVCIDCLPGQEQENLRVSVSAGTATWLPTVADVATILGRAPEMTLLRGMPSCPPSGRALANAVLGQFASKQRR